MGIPTPPHVKIINAIEEYRLTKDKVRVYVLARELNMESKDLLDMCRGAGLDLKNQLSSVDPDQQEEIKQLVKRGGTTAPSAKSPPKPARVMPPVTAKVRVLSGTRPKPQEAAPQTREADTPTEVQPAQPQTDVSAPAAETGSGYSGDRCRLINIYTTRFFTH